MRRVEELSLSVLIRLGGEGWLSASINIRRALEKTGSGRGHIMREPRHNIHVLSFCSEVRTRHMQADLQVASINHSELTSCMLFLSDPLFELCLLRKEWEPVKSLV